jgi:trigger factor
MGEEIQEQTDQSKAPAAAGEKPKEEKGPANKVELADAGTLKKKVTVTIPREKIDAKFGEMFGELAGTAQVPGFRIGHAPRRLIEKRFGKEVSRDVRNAIIGESLGDAIEKSELKTLGEPEIDLDKIELPASGDMSFTFEVELMPEFTLPELKGLEVEKHAVEVTDERVDEYLEQLRVGRARFEDTDGAAAEGDAVQAGAKISGDGIEPFERHGLALRVAPGQIEGLPLVDLGKALAGKKAGETATLKMTVPNAHPNENWRGKEVTVEISLGQVRGRILPKLNDEFASSGGFASLNEMRQFVSGRLKSRVAAEMQRNMREQICQHLLNSTKFDLPDGVVNRHTARVLQRRYVDLLYQGMPREQVDEHITELQAAASEQAKRDLQLSLILDRIAKDEKIEVTDDEVNSRIAQMAATQNRRPERLRQEFAQNGTLEQVRTSLGEEKVLDKLLEQANIKEVKPAEKPEKKAKAEKPAKRQAGAKKPAAKKPAAKKAKGKSPQKGRKKSGRK